MISAGRSMWQSLVDRNTNSDKVANNTSRHEIVVITTNKKEESKITNCTMWPEKRWEYNILTHWSLWRTSISTMPSTICLATDSQLSWTVFFAKETTKWMSNRVRLDVDGWLCIIYIYIWLCVCIYIYIHMWWGVTSAHMLHDRVYPEQKIQLKARSSWTQSWKQQTGGIYMTKSNTRNQWGA